MQHPHAGTAATMTRSRDRHLESDKTRFRNDPCPKPLRVGSGAWGLSQVRVHVRARGGGSPGCSMLCAILFSTPHKLSAPNIDTVKSGPVCIVWRARVCVCVCVCFLCVYCV
jgi:hypothetical protein